MRRIWPTRLASLATIPTAMATVILLAGCGGSATSHTSKPASSQANATAAEVSSLLAGIPQRGNELGNPKAPVTVQYFGDLQCPFCRRFTLALLPSVIQSYVRTGAVRLEFRSYETATRDPRTFELQQKAAMAAGKQNKMWNYIELFYHQQGEEDSGYVTESYLEGLAREVPGLDLVAWSAARNDPALAATLSSDEHAAVGSGLPNTPSFLLYRAMTTPSGRALKRLLSEALKGS